MHDAEVFVHDNSGTLPMMALLLYNECDALHREILNDDVLDLAFLFSFLFLMT